METGHKIYKTKQRDILVKYLTENQEKCFTSGELIEVFRNELGAATVYRLLSKLTQEGILRKFVSNEGEGAHYQINHVSECANHFHLRCVKCGELIHADYREIDEMEKNLKKEYHFTVDNTKTVIYGVCGECEGKK